MKLRRLGYSITDLHQGEGYLSLPLSLALPVEQAKNFVSPVASGASVSRAVRLLEVQPGPAMRKPSWPVLDAEQDARDVEEKLEDATTEESFGVFAVQSR